MKKLFVQLSGGLGNQLFQYATARAIALNSDRTLFLDTWSGFVRDSQYRRHYQLSALKVKEPQIDMFSKWPLWLHKIRRKVFRNSVSFCDKTWYGDFYIEREFKYQLSLNGIRSKRSIWLLGYWQSPRYFEKYADLLRTELMPDLPANRLIRSVGKDMYACESVALGVRLYEESVDPSSHALYGIQKNSNEINRAIQNLRTRKPNIKIFVFCTHRAKQLKELDLPSNTVFLTPEDGFSDAIDCLWLLTQSKHHIFTNSSYYWWGAWLSHGVHKQEEQLIYAADNFINVDGLCAHWLRF